ncbi:MAG: transposase [Hyphomicrobiales bacterium]|nr:transposase [Hyphomicrobiales bacterium]
MHNRFVERFEIRLRDERLNETLFTSLAHAHYMLMAWRFEYNQVRPYSKLGGSPPGPPTNGSGGMPPEPLPSLQPTIIKESKSTSD